jgi:hypothetical protein
MLVGEGNHSRRAMSRAYPGIRFSCAVTVALALGALGVAPVSADDPPRTPGSAFVAGYTSSPMSRLGARLPNPAAGMDLNLLLAQYSPANTEPSGNLAKDRQDDIILVALTLTTPVNVEEEIARDHGLHLVERTELTALGLRIIRYRVGDSRSADSVIATLLRDARVERAQRSVAYRLPVQPPAPVAGAEKAPAIAAVPRNSRLADRKTAVRVAQPVAPMPDDTQVAARVDETLDLGDVLSGGL